jgi:hypothetical protein
MTKKEVQFEARPVAKKEASPSKEQWIRAGGAGRAKRFTFDVPEEMHSAFKSYCALQGVNMQDKLIALMEAELAQTTTRPATDTHRPQPGFS